MRTMFKLMSSSALKTILPSSGTVTEACKPFFKRLKILPKNLRRHSKSTTIRPPPPKPKLHDCRSKLRRPRQPLRRRQLRPSSSTLLLTLTLRSLTSMASSSPRQGRECCRSTHRSKASTLRNKHSRSSSQDCRERRRRHEGPETKSTATKVSLKKHARLSHLSSTELERLSSIFFLKSFCRAILVLKLQLFSSFSFYLILAQICKLIPVTKSARVLANLRSQ